MYRLLAVIALTVMVSLMVMAPGPATALPKGCYGITWTGTIYYSDPGKTQVVGSCSITCQQYVAGTAAPYFGGGGTCTGTSGPYTTNLFQTCPCQN